ncbi:MAG: hypothetical protein QOF83_3146 [Solirubrobacteraceae bacterium]|jgi:hypothetical protein|nr:hypothetical protein [Solirubrobacteraceae bacterium]
MNSLGAFELGPRALGVEVLDAHQKAGVLRAGKQPGDQRGAEAAQVQRTGGRGRETAVGRHRRSRGYR